MNVSRAMWWQCGQDCTSDLSVWLQRELSIEVSFPNSHTQDTKDPVQELISECTVYSSQNNSNEVTTGEDLRAWLIFCLLQNENQQTSRLQYVKTLQCNCPCELWQKDKVLKFLSFHFVISSGYNRNLSIFRLRKTRFRIVITYLNSWGHKVKL